MCGQVDRSNTRQHVPGDVGTDLMHQRLQSVLLRHHRFDMIHVDA